MACVFAGGGVAAAVVNDRIYLVRPTLEANLAGTKIPCISMSYDAAATYLNR